jgi:hypothetical protein
MLIHFVGSRSIFGMGSRKVRSLPLACAFYSTFLNARPLRPLSAILNPLLVHIWHEVKCVQIAVSLAPLRSIPQLPAPSAPRFPMPDLCERPRPYIHRLPLYIWLGPVAHPCHLPHISQCPTFVTALDDTFIGSRSILGLGSRVTRLHCHSHSTLPTVVQRSSTSPWLLLDQKIHISELSSNRRLPPTFT